MDTLSVLIIDDDSHRCESLALLLEFMEYEAQQVHTPEEAQQYNNTQFDLIIAYAAQTISASLNELNTLFPSSKVAVLFDSQAFDTQESDADQQTQSDLLSSRCQKYPNFLGILEFPVKKQQFKTLISPLFEESNLKTQPTVRPVKRSGSILDELFVGESVVIQQVKKLINQVAKSNASVLILGESGTGKEVVANCLHKLSKRNKMPYVPVNCGAIPRDLLESELFGHEKGAFTGALSTRKGRFEMAQGGSLFLDEIGDMPLSMQVKILRVLQERIFERVGGNKSLRADVRVIAATHRELETEVKEGRFREDLFYRLNVFPIEIPALRERAEDIPLLFNVLNQRMQDDTEYSVQLTPEAMASLMQHPWPGNVRELSNLVERLGIMFPDERIEWDDLPEKYQYDITHISDLPELDWEQQIQEQLQEQAQKESDHASYLEEQQLLEEDASSYEQQDKPESEDAAFLSDTSMPPLEHLPKEDFDLKDHLANLENSLIQQALEESGGVVAHAAKRLNMRRTTLVEKMKKYEVMFPS